MYRLLLAAAFLLYPAIVAAERPCPRQPMPPAIDSAGRSTDDRFSHSIAFAARPSLELPGRAWVVVLDRKPRTHAASINIFRLRRQSSCNRYDIEQKWTSELTASQYRIIAEGIVSLTVPRPEGFTDPESKIGRELILDGTSLEVELRGSGWTVRRLTNASSKDGAAISKQMYSLVATIVPRRFLPTEEWRTPPGR